MPPLLDRLKAWEAWEPPGIGGIPPHVTPPEPVKGEEVISEIERLVAGVEDLRDELWAHTDDIPTDPLMKMREICARLLAPHGI